MNLSSFRAGLIRTYFMKGSLEIRGQAEMREKADGKGGEDSGVRYQRVYFHSAAMLCKLDYFRRDAVEFLTFLKETADALNCVSNHLFRHLRIDR